ncbi:hypothetical protein [Burkholderia pseudomultivorans]|uniref:Uncharacterized protein n=1 Tax=Burkholderia pseudomultivorans TaxID=1207504 RepID=A0ABU2ED27_9BURK|nr:hypothetical protein [Burkholderia pseudomultivorans]MDR8731335.1 hypothetical protein [Burkholderia pseudomultivorans]MDR8738956.1 hypothetical protein [Burkholderia pseudomultivorans]MDR8745507.1 hypothetical protein [Burkholderia pseudomultivorans]MDR8757791.1 hypothetical protein [Burkholderia pseudomultivorans]MDR8781891.1 hypothetical protein [Burkholderia pseudomultivorans]
MRIMNLSDIAVIVRHARLGVFLIMLAIGAWQIHDALHATAGQAPGHLIVAAVAIGVGARLYLAKRSQINLALTAIEAAAARNRTT